MNTYKLSNVPLKEFKKFLIKSGFKHIRTEGGHFIYSRNDQSRSFVLQTHVDPVSEFVVKQLLRNIGISRKKFWEIIKEK